MARSTQKLNSPLRGRFRSRLSFPLSCASNVITYSVSLTPAPTFKKKSSGFSYDNSFVSTGTYYHRFHIKKWIFHVFLWKNVYLIHMIDPIQYEFWFFFFTTLADPEPEPKLRYSGSLRLRLHNTAYKTTHFEALSIICHNFRNLIISDYN